MPNARTYPKRSYQRGQAAVLMAVVIALLFALFTLVFEVGRLLIAREVAISASRRAGEAGLSYMVDYAQRRSDWNEAVQRARRNVQVWNTFYDENTGVPKWVRDQALRYLQKNLDDHYPLVAHLNIAQLDKDAITFPYKEPNWPTSTIGLKMHVTVNIPLVLLAGLQPSVPITVETISITSVEELLGVPTDAVVSVGAGGAATELTGAVGKIPGSTTGWVEPFAHFAARRPGVVLQEWGCPKEVISAYNYAGGRHAGIDLAVVEGTPLYAVADGTIMYAEPYVNGKAPRVGNMSISIQTDDGYKATYLHMLNFTVKAGDRVKAGDLIGASDGDPSLHKDNPAFTGFSTGAHLHFQVSKGGVRGLTIDYPYDVDPAPFLGLGNSSRASPSMPLGPCFPAPPK